nr:MAG TPA: shufflon protein [Caudoviricetes sp.]
MSTWNIYHKDGSKLTDVNGEQITVHGLEYSDSWMGECFLTINFKHEVPINFQIGDYIVYRGERFELNYEPGKDKQARPDTYGEGFVYDSVKFNALQDELARAEFLDVVLNDNELHYTSLPKFPFYVQTLDDLLDRIQANLDEQIGAGLWKIYSRNKDRSVQRGALASEWLSVYGEKTEDNVIESMSITVDSQTCWQALALVNEKWDVNFIVRGRNIYVGTTGIEAGHIFSYGLGKGLYEIVQNADSDQSVITRLRAYGSEKNLPSHYYADLGVKYVANITKVVTASTNVELELDVDYIETYFKNKRKYIVSGQTQEQSNGWVLQVTFDFQTTITGYVIPYGSSGKCRFYSELKGTQTDTGDEESKEKLDAFIAQVKAGNTKMYITSGLNKKVVPSSMKEYAKNLPNNMSINRLMLPGFPHVSLSDFYDSLTEQEKKYVNPTGKLHKFSTDPYRPYIDSLNIEEIGLRSASQFFDTDDKTNGVIEIYPTIEEMEIGGVRVDEIDEGVAPDDDGRFGDNETVKNVDIYLNKAIDFDINDLKDDDFSISMKDGMCGGRTFKVASSTKVDGRWRLTIERIKDDALELWFPYKDYPIKNGDHFVLTGITLPDSYVNAASLKLLKYAIALLDKNDYTRYVYQPKVDELFMARQHDKAQADETGTIKSLHDTLKAGDLMNFNDTDLNIEGIISIDQLTIKEEDGKIPTYDITLREDKEVGTIQKIQQQISSLQNGNGGTGAGLTTTQVKNQVATEGSKHFISKINDDTANGTITWEKVQKLVSGLLVGNFNNENGGSWTPDAEGRSHLITDYLEVRMKAIFEELVVKKTSTIGGKEIISPAGGVVAHKVEEVTVTYKNVSQKAYRCYFLAEQEGDSVDNDFAVNDQVRSESFNVRKGTYHKVGNHFYWRLVIGRDEEPVELEGKKYHYIDLSDTDCATASDVPAKGDVLSQCGNRTDVERQNCLIFSAVDTYSPSVSLYHGINSYSFANKEYVEYGVNKQNNKAFFNVYGDMYVGDRPTKENGYEGSSYIRYDSSTKQVSVKGKISSKSTVDGKELSQYIKENSAKGLTEEQVNNLIKNSQVIADLQNQVDGAIETWFYDGVPTLENAPANSWKTDKNKETHLGDLYYDNKTGKAYRFAKDGNTYKWTIIADTDIAKALSDASKAQETADGKMKVFSAQPIPPYQLGDIWVNATYPTDGRIYKNEILRCQTAKAKGSSFAIADWTKASKYTDDSALNTFKEEYKNDMASYKEQLDEKVETWFYNYAPTTQNKPAFDWTTDTLKSQHAGDLFYNTSNGYTYRWTGTAWERIKDNDINTAMTAASKAQDTADGKRTVFTSQPTVPYDEGDLWASGGDDGKTLMVCVKSRATGSFTSSEWVKANDSDLNAFAKTIEESLTGIRDQLDKKAETWYQPSDPSTSWTTDDAKKEHKGDLWYNTSNNQTFFWNGTKWDKQDVPTEVFDKIDGKSSIYVSKPASYEERDLWILEAAYTLGGVAYSKGELVVATKSNASFSAADWTKKVKYTDDTVANAAKKAAEEAKKAADTAQTNVTNLGKTVTSNKKAFDNYVTDGYLEPSEIAAMAQDSKRLEDAFAAAQKSYNEVKEAEVLTNTNELTDLNTAFATLTTAKTELVTYLSDISARYNAANTEKKATIVSAVGTKFTNFQSAYSAFYDKLGLANAYITSKIYGDLKQNITDLAGYKYIKDALGQTTDIDGGLVMTTLLALRDADGNIQSGINGAIDTNRGKKSIATWWGGQMVDKDYNSGSLTPATSLVRFDGSGYLANGAIWWDVDGKVHADPTSFIISEKNLGAYLAFFEPTWKSGSNGTNIKDLVALTPQAPFTTLSVSNDLLVEGKLKIGSITLSVVNGALKIDGNVYSTGGMSAYGEGTSNGGGLNGSIVPFDKAKFLTAQNEGTEIASAWSIKKLYDMINSIDVTGQLADYLKKTEASTLYQPKGNYLTSHQDISGKSDKTHTHSVKINGVTKTIAATGGTAVDLGTYLTSHQSLAAYLKSADAEKTYSKLGHTHAFSEITGKPTTLAGYGVTDGVNAVSVTGNGNAVTSASIDGHTLTLTKGSTFSLSGHTHTFASLTSKPTTIAGYGITDAYTKAQVDSTIAKYLPLAGGTITGALTVNGIATFKSKVAIGDIYIINDGSGNLYVQKTDGKTAANFYATGGITAFGASSVSGGTGSGLNGSVLGFEKATAMTSADNGDSSKTEVSFLATAWSIKQLNDKINAFGTGVFSDYLTIAAAKATYQPKGSYLTSHQTIYGLTIQKNGTSLGTYTPNSAAKTINVTVPTKLSELSNDSGYTKNTGTVTSVAISVPTGLSVSGSPITTNGTIAIALASGYSIPTTAKQTAWDGAVSAKHTHSNKSVLDGISSTKVSHWNSAYDWYALMTTDEETADGIINKWNEVVSFLANIAQTDTLSGIVDGINKSISDEVARAKKAEGVNASGISANKGSIATLQGYFTNGSAKKALQLTNARKLWGNSFNGTADINGSIIVPSGKYISIGNIKLEYDAANKALKITNTTTNEVANLYATGGISAYGEGSAGTTGSNNFSAKAYADSIKLTSENLSEIASAYSIAVLNNSLNAAIGRISTLEGGSATSIETTGSGNAVTSVSKSGTKITFTKGSTFSLNGHTHDFITVGANQTITATQYTKSRLSVRPYYNSGGPTTYGNILEVVSGNSGGGQLGMEWSGSQTKTDGTDTNVGKLYYRSKRDNMAGWTVWKRVAFAEELAWGNISGKPTSLSGYGITDGVNAVSVTGSGNAVTAASVSGHTLTLTKGSSFSLSNHTHYIGTTQVQGNSAEQALTGITKIDNILKLSKASVTVNTSYKAEQNRLVIYGSTYGNDANYIKSAGKLSYGDGGPQLVFSTSENPDASGVQSAALVYTDHDTIGAGVSLSFVTNQGDAYFIAPHIKALTAFQGNLAWSYITNKPTTLSGFGITDGLRSVTHPSGSNVFVTGISTSGTAITYTKSYTKKSLSAVGTSGWTNTLIDGNIIPDMSFIAYWNGAYSGTSSNLAYCNKGAFGSFAIKNSLAFSELTSKPTTISGYGITDAYTKSQVDAIAAKYLPLTGGTLTGQLKIVASALNGAYNGLRIGDDCYIGDCNLGNTIGLMGVSNNNAGMVKFGKGGMQFGYNGSNHIASTTAQWTNLNADLLDGWHKNNIVWSGAVNSNTASLSHYWAKLFDITVTGNQYDDRSFTFLFSNGFNDTYSVVVLRIRQNGAKDSGAYNFSISLRELVGNMSSRLRVYYNNATGNVQLWGNCQGQYGSLSYTIIKKTGRTSADFTSQGTLVTNTSFSAAQSLPATTGDSPYSLLDGATRIGIVKQADQLVTARSLWGQSFNGTANVSGNMTGVGNINTSAAPAGTIYTNNWFRSKGSTGWYSEDHGGGWYMSDNTWIRNFGGKDVYLSNRLSVNGNVGIGTTDPSHKLHVLGEIYTTTKVNINGIILEKDSNGDLKVNGNLYATGGISAYGASDGTSSGGGLNGSVKSYADALKLTSESLSEIASAYSIKALASRISSLEGGSATSISVSGSGNAVTSVTKNGTTISVVKGSTFLTAHQSLAGYMKTATADAKYMYHSRNNIVSDLNSFATNGAAHIYEMNNVTNGPNSNSWVQVMNWGTGDSDYGFLLANDYATNGHMYFRQKIAGSWKDWKTIIDSSNIGSQSVNYAASAGSVAWTNVSGRPSTMKNPSALSWSGYSSGSYDGSAAKSISIPNNTNQLTNGAGFITSSASITGNAGSATKLQTTRTLWGQSFNGTANISGSMTGVGDMTLDAGARIKHGSGNLYIGNSDNSNWIGVQDICSQSSIGDGNWSLRTSGAAHFKDTTINGTATIKNLLSLVDGSHKGLKMGSTYISSLDGEVILQGNTALRFGNDAWDYNQWAGLKYDHSSKTVYLGIADGSIFKANSAQSGGVINLKQGISSVYTPELYAGGDIYHTGVYRMLWKNSKASKYLNVMNISQDDNGILTIGYGNFSNNKNVVLEGYNLNFRVGNDSGMKSMWLNYNNGNPVLSLDGNFYATGGVTAYKSSDERLKHDIHGVDSLAIIKAMGGTVAFRYNADNKDSIGWIAQRVLHNTFMQDLVEKDDKGFLKINYWSPKLIAVAFGAIEQVDDEVSRLKRRVRDLENEVEQLKSDRL